MITRLHLNENVFTCDSPVFSSILNRLDLIYLYPDMKYNYSKKILADWLGVKQEQVVLGNGSSELIQRIYLDKLGGKGRVVFPWPSYVLYSELEVLSGIPACKVPLGYDLKVDLKVILNYIDKDTKLVILCNPNNPTGTVFKKSELEEFLKHVPEEITVLVDEAYIDYIDEIENYSALELVNKWNNLIVVKTFSKLYGLAALRLGYAVASEKIASWLQSKLPNWNINRVAEIALDVCINHPEYFNRVRDDIKTERVWVFEQIQKLGFKTVPSSTNFLYVYNYYTCGLQNLLEESGIMVKSIKGLDYEAVRITIGKRADNEEVINGLQRCIELSKKI